MSRSTLWGEAAADSWCWYAQDRDGIVWYMGEETCEYKNDECVSYPGAWEAGVDRYNPDLIMPGDPLVGDAFCQENYVGRAVDMGEVVTGWYTGCMKTRETRFLDPGYEAFAYDCPGVGFAMPEEGSEYGLLIEMSLP